MNNTQDIEVPETNDTANARQSKVTSINSGKRINTQTPHQDGNQEKSKPAEGGRGWGGPEDGSYATNGGGGGGHDAAFAAGAGGGSNHASSTDQSNEWVDDVDNNPYEYPQASSSTDTTANSN